MGSFDEAVHEAVNSLQPFVQVLDDAHRECQVATGYLETLGEGLKTYRKALDEMVGALVHDSHEVEQVLSATTTDATTNLGSLQEGVGQALQEWEEVFGAEKTALGGATELLPGLGIQVKELAEKAEETTRRVLEWAASVSQELDEVVALAEHTVTVGMSALVADWRRALEGAAKAIIETFEQESQHVADHEKEWQAKVDQVNALLDDAFERISAHDVKVEEYVDEKWSELKDAQIEATLKDQVPQVVSGLHSLSVAAENHERQVEAAATMITGEQQHATQDAAQLAEGLFKVRELWFTFGINS